MQLTKVVARVVKFVTARVFVALAVGAAALGVGAAAVGQPTGTVTIDRTGPESAEDATSPPLPRAHGCTTTVSTVSAARNAVQAASGGEVVCLAAGSYGIVDLKEIDKPIDNRVTFRGVGERATTISELQWAGSSGLVIENLRSTGAVTGGHQYPADHITFRYMDVSNSDGEDCFNGSGADAGQDQIVIVRNFIHDCGQDGIGALGAVGWTVRYNRFERIREDYIQSDTTNGWVVDHNVMGPGDFNRPAGYDGHPDIWQSLNSGHDVTFTNNLVKDTNESLGFIFGRDRKLLGL